MNMLPDFTVTCRADGQLAPDIPILVQIAMIEKNDFHIVAGLTGGLGQLKVTSSELIKEVTATLDLFPSDYDPVSTETFTGVISVHAMTLPEVEAALHAYDLFNTSVNYPTDSRRDLQTGYRKLLQISPKRISVEIGGVQSAALTTRITTGSSAFPAMAAAIH